MRILANIRNVIYGSIIIGIFAVIHLIFPPKWSRWVQKSNEMFAGTRPQFIGLYIFGCFLFFIYMILYGIWFFGSFGKKQYPKGSENFFPEISVIVPALNEEKIIGGTLDAYANSKYPKDKLELVIVASGSTDKTVEICREYKDRLSIKIITDPLPRKGKPAALNIGFKHASHDFICVYDADTRVQEETLNYLVRPLYNPEVDAAQGPVMIRNWNVNRLTKAVALEYTFLVGSGIYFEIRERLGRFLWLFGRNYCIRKSVLEEFGGWKEDALTEDLHLSTQLAAAKKKLRYAPHALSSENTPTTYQAFKRQRQRWAGGYSQCLDAAMELDKRTVIRRNLSMLHYGQMVNISVGALIAGLIFGLVAKDFYIMIVCLTIFFFFLGIHVNAVRKYGNKKYRLLLSIFSYFWIEMYFFKLQIKNVQMEEWEKTEE